MNVGSLFSGIGGIELGFEREGFKTSWFVEKDSFCQKILQKHRPNTPIYGDITKIDFRELEYVDIITGGFPCQDISIAGKRKGITAERSGLWKQYARCISEIRPRFAVIENVANLVNFGLDQVLIDLAKIGYDAEWTTLCASDFGALHKRERIFIIAYSNESRLEETRSEQQTTKNRRYSSVFITNDFGNRVQRFTEQTLSGEQGIQISVKNVKCIEDLQNRSDIPQPLIRRSDHGIPNRMDRTKAIGNAVVPQVAQFIARQIKE